MGRKNYARRNDNEEAESDRCTYPFIYDAGFDICTGGVVTRPKETIKVQESV